MSKLTRLAATATTAVVALGATVAGVAPASAADVAVAAVPSAAPVTQSVRVDVDGDRRMDTVTLIQVASMPDEAYRLTVRTATGRTSTVRHEAGYLYGRKPLFAATAVDGQAGAELIVRTAPGMHTDWFRVYTWRNNRLVTANEPTQRKPDWFTDPTDPSGYRVFTRGGTRYLERTELQRTGQYNTGPLVGQRLTFRWRAGQWQRIAKKSLRVNLRDGEKYVGWQGIRTL